MPFLCAPHRHPAAGGGGDVHGESGRHRHHHGRAGHGALVRGVAPLSLNIGISAYLLTLGVFIPISGWMADRFGARRIFAAAILIFTIASLLCGRAETLTSFVLLRILQGIGGAMMVPVGRYVVLRETPRDKLMGALALLTWPALAAPVLGPVVGGFITTYFSWRWIFYLNVPLGLIAMVAVWVLLPPDPPARSVLSTGPVSSSWAGRSSLSCFRPKSSASARRSRLWRA